MVPAGCKHELVSPAKINLSLAILGKQADGFHALHSVVVQTEYGDRLDFQWNPESNSPDLVSFSESGLDSRNNTLWSALQAFRETADMHHGQFILHLNKHIPIGAGLGGGSSNAVAVLRALMKTFPETASALDWNAIAAGIGSDCPLFLVDQPVIMEGRGEKISQLEASLAERVRGLPVILFKPGFSINTAEAYRRLARGRYYHEKSSVVELMTEWRGSENILPRRCNDFERLVEDWVPGLSVVLDRLRNKHGLDARMSGSGSACFLFPKDEVFDMRMVREELASAWGSSYWMQQTCVK